MNHGTMLQRLYLVVCAAICLGMSCAPAEAGGRRKVLKLKTDLERAESVQELLTRYRQSSPASRPQGAQKLRFAGVAGKDVYNPSKPFFMGGKQVIAGRVESRSVETISELFFFDRRDDGALHKIEGAPNFELEGPFVN